MLATFLIALREGLEAALVIGILLSVLHRLGEGRQARLVWSGVAVAVVVSLVVGIALNALGVALAGPAEPIFEGTAMVLAVIVLTYMIFWMGQQGRQVQSGLETQVKGAVAGGRPAALFSLAFLSVVREGVETALFLTAASFGLSALQAWVGTLLGLVAAAGLGVLLFVGGRRIDLRSFFRVTGVLLLVIAAGLLGRGIGEFHESGLLPVVVGHVYDLNPILNEESPVGTFLTALVGYSSSPSLVQVVAYGLYVVIVGVAFWRAGRRPERAMTPVVPPSAAETARSAPCEPEKEGASC